MISHDEWRGKRRQGGQDDAQGEGAARAPPLWEYKDASGSVRGPYTTADMLLWQLCGGLRDGVLVSRVGAGGGFVPVTRATFLS